MFKKIIIFTIILGFLLPNFGFGQTPLPNIIELPKTIDEAKRMTEGAIGVAEKQLPNILEQIWEKEVIPTWKAMWEWFYSVWNRHIELKIKEIWQWIKGLLGVEVEKRRPIIEEELQKEKQEIKQELPLIGQSLWERFKELIR